MVRAWVMFIVFVCCLAGCASCARASSQKIVLTQDVIQNSGLTRLGDIFLLLDNWRASTMDGYEWKASANGLAPYQGQTWTLMLDGSLVDVNVFGANNLNLLPVALDQIDSVVVVSSPQIHCGVFADRGIVHIYTRRPAAGVSFRGSLMGGNETGDPGPYRYTPLRSPNLDGIGPDASYTLGFSYGKWYALGNLATQIHFFQDPSMRERNKRILKPVSLNTFVDAPPSRGGRSIQSIPGRFGFDEVFPGMRRTASSLRSGFQWDAGRIDASLGYTHAHRYFLFFQPLGREIPVNNNYLHAGMNGSLSLTPDAHVHCRFKYSSNRLAESSNTLGADFDWERRVAALNLEGDYVRESLHVIGGGVLRNVSLDTHFALDDDSYNFGAAYGAVAYDFFDRFRQEVSLSGAFCNDEAAMKASLANHWRVNARHDLSLRLAYSQRLFEEDNSLWYWAARGYDILDSLGVAYTITGGFAKSSLFASDVEWSAAILDECTGSLAFSYRSFGDLYLERQAFVFDSTNCSFSSPVVVETGCEGRVFGVNLSADLTAPRSLHHHLFYNYQSAVAGDDAFKDVWETVPGHHAGYRLTYAPSAGFRVWGMLSYLSSSYWPDYSGIDGEVCEANSPSSAYYATVNSSTILDLQLQKWFWHRRIRWDFICRNVWNNELQYHPIGASFDLTIYLRLKLFFSSGERE
jgi:hypothetical protein